MISTEHGDHIVFDRNYIHPGENAEVAHGIGMVEGSRFVGIVNSYIGGLNCIAGTGKCTDATAIGGAHSDAPSEPSRSITIFSSPRREHSLWRWAVGK